MKAYKKYLLMLAVIGVLAFLISTFWIQFALIQGDSMEPAYHSGQLVLLRKNVKDLQAGDVVAFRSPKGILIKRIAAGPEDTVQIVEGRLYVNDTPKSGDFEDKDIEYAGLAADPVILGKEEYFVLGDNVAYSKDSRYEEIGCIKKEDIIGKVILMTEK